MKIYLAHPITGSGYEAIFQYYYETARILTYHGFEVLQPMTGKGELRNEVEFKSTGYDHFPMSTNHAIVERDNWMVHQADVVYVNLEGSEKVSIGCVMELAWAHDLRKHTVLTLPEENVHRHAFMLECADLVWPSHDEAITYLLKLVKNQF